MRNCVYLLLGQQLRNEFSRGESDSQGNKEIQAYSKFYYEILCAKNLGRDYGQIQQRCVSKAP